MGNKDNKKKKKPKYYLKTSEGTSGYQTTATTFYRNVDDIDINDKVANEKYFELTEIDKETLMRLKEARKERKERREYERLKRKFEKNNP